TGADLSPMMLEIGRQKVEQRGFSDRISLVECNALKLPFADLQFDAVTAAFGVRNFEDLPKGLSEMYRVTKRGGKIYILEFSKPQKGIISTFYLFYFRRILPAIGRLVSKDENAYSYLPDSVLTFPSGNEFTKILGEVGYRNCKSKMLTFGIATIYEGEKL
ncbi:MAG: ubiquinone/menaquinone biosynthesis methyltransferase, partial [Rikenellaceae bacterium]